MRDAEHRMNVQKIIDSTNRVEAIRVYNKRMIDRVKITDLLNDMRIEFPNSAQISLFYTHDSGGKPTTGTPLNMTTLYVADNIEPCLRKNYWQNRPVPDGYLNYYIKLYFAKFLYISDLEQELTINFGESKDIISCNDRKATMGIVLKETGFEVYYIVVNWDFVNPVDSNPRAGIILRKYAAEISQLIETKSP